MIVIICILLDKVLNDRDRLFYIEVLKTEDLLLVYLFVVDLLRIFTLFIQLSIRDICCIVSTRVIEIGQKPPDAG